MDLNYLLELAVAQGASDLHLKAGGLPVARIHGKLVPVSEHKMEPDEVEQMASKAMPPAHQSRLKDMQEIDFAYSVHRDNG
jgi:twitching motility protein PilT